MAGILKLRACYDRATAGTEGRMVTVQQWNDYMTELVRNNHLAHEEAEMLDKVKPALPTDFERVLMTMAQCRGDQQLSRLTELSYQLDEDVVNTRALLDNWNLQMMNHTELSHVLAQLARVESTLLTTEELVRKTTDKLHQYSEDTQRGLYDKVYDLYKALRNAHNYQDEEYENIEKQWHSQRVRHVQYRNRAIRIIKSLPSGITRQVGFCADKDFPLEVLTIPHSLMDYDYLQTLYHHISASKQLIFSKYFANYYGFDDLSDPDFNLFFFELMKGQSIRKLLNGRVLLFTQLLFRYWTRELLNAFTDLLLRCTHEVRSDITLANVFTQDFGMRLYLKGVEFGEIRQEASHYETEARFLTMFGSAVLEMLTGGGPSTLPSLFTASEFKTLDPALRSIIEESVKSYGRYEEKLLGEVVQETAVETAPRKRKTQRPQDQHAVLKDSLTFLRLQTHPYFRTSEVTLQVEVEPLAEEFEALEKASKSLAGDSSFSVETKRR